MKNSQFIIGLNIETFVNKKPALMRSALKDLAIVFCLHKDTYRNV